MMSIHSINPEEPDTAQKAREHNIPLLLIAKNENGDIAEYGQRGGGPGERFSMFLDKSFVQGSKRINVTVEHVPYEMVFEWQLHFPIYSEDKYKQRKEAHHDS